MAKKSKLEQFKDRLSLNGAFSKNENPIAKDMISLIGDDVPYSMALAISNFIMSSFVGHFHYKIHLGEDNLVPPNIIAFILAKSGAKKTSSVIKLEKAIQPGLDIIQEIRKRKAEEVAKETDTPVAKLMPLSNALSTVPGLLANLNRFKAEGIGLPTMVVDEVATAISTNLDFIPNVEVVSQLFDNGDNKVKVLKDQEQQSEEVKGMGMNALFIGSEKAILDDRQILKAFETEFVSKLARRCFFVYPSFKADNSGDDDDIDSYIAMMKEKKNGSKFYEQKLKDLSARIASRISQKDLDLNLIIPTEETITLWELYEFYCVEKAKTIPDEEEHRILEQQHRHWKAFKLSGVYAVWDMSPEIEPKHLLQAIYAAELTSGDLTKFMNMARREGYEVVLDLFDRDPNRVFTLHELIKLKIIKSDNYIDALVRNANSKLGTTSHVEYISGKLSYHEHNVVDKYYEHWASYKKVSSIKDLYENLLQEGLDDADAKRTAKEIVAKEAQSDYTSKPSSWEKLGNLLKNDVAYVPYRLKTIAEGASYSDYTKDAKGGIRRKDNICSPATYVVFDIDDTDISFEEMRDNIQDYTYHMALGSNPDNPYKYRILMPLDIEVELEPSKWKEFVKIAAANILFISVDDLPQSQFYFGYAGREVYSNVGESINAAEIISCLKTEVKKIGLVSREGRSELWEMRKNEFKYFYKVESGRGLHMSLFKVMTHMLDLGFSVEEIQNMIEQMIEEKKVYPRAGYLQHSLWPQLYERAGVDKYGVKIE